MKQEMIEEYLEKYNNYISLIEREGFEEFKEFLENKTDFLTKARASSRFHCSCDYGLFIHTVSMIEVALRLKRAYNVSNDEISDESVILTCLIHDVGKIGMYKQNPPTPAQQRYGYEGSWTINDEIPWMEHEIRSLYYARSVRLKPMEYAAIAYHNEPWNGNNFSRFRNNKLLTIIQNADYWSSNYLEDENGIK